MKDKVKEIISYISHELLSQENMPAIEKKVINELQAKGYEYYEISEALTFIIKFIENNKTKEKSFKSSMRVFSIEEKFKLTQESRKWLMQIYEYRSISFAEFEDVMAIVSSSVRIYDVDDIKNLVQSMRYKRKEIPEKYVLN